MATLESLGNVLSTDILVIGGGIAGLTSAVSAKETAPDADVLVVEKATSGWAGKANKGAGIFMALRPEDDPAEFVRFHVKHIGYGLEDQDLLLEFARTTVEVLEHFASWGPKLYRNEDGTLRYGDPPSPSPVPWAVVASDLDMMLSMVATAKKKGVKFVDKVAIVDLLKDGDRVAGAIGFSVIDGTTYIIKAKATVLANGGQNYRIVSMFSSGRGDGIAAAYRAGAEMRNPEFSGFINMLNAHNKEIAFGAETVMYNARGENITQSCMTDHECDVFAAAAVAWYKEMAAGRGPVYGYMHKNFLAHQQGDHLINPTYWARPKANAFWRRLFEKDRSSDPGSGPRLAVLPGFLGELGPVKVDHQMATTLPGLFAAGDVCYNGTAMCGAVPAPPGRKRGAGLLGAVFFGLKAGPAAARYVSAGASAPEVDVAQAETFKAEMFAPLNRSNGIPPIEMVHAVQDVMSPVKYSIWKSQDRMEEALGKVLEIEAKLPEMKAADYHHLAACHEARAMALCAEIYYRASLMRKESRGWHIREDYPATDNANWLKWIVLQDRKGEMAAWTEDVPIDRYPVKP